MYPFHLPFRKRRWYAPEIGPDCASQKIARLLKDGGFIKNPQVSLTVKEFQSQKIPVMGKINKPGEYALKGESRVIDMITQAGGLKEDAADVIIVVKESAGKTIKNEVDLLRFYAGDMDQNIQVSEGDFVLVPKMNTFYIHGEILHIGIIKFCFHSALLNKPYNIFKENKQYCSTP